MFRQVSSYMIANIVSAMFGFASVVLFTRILTPQEYGIYIIGFSVAAMISTVLFGWIKASVMRITAEEGAADVRLTTAYSCVFLALLIPILMGGANIFAPEASEYLLPAIILAFTIGFFEFYLEIFRARQQTTVYMWATIVRAGLALAFSCILVMVFDFGGRGLLISIALSYMLAAALYSVQLWRRPLHPFDTGILKEMLRFGLPMAFSGSIFMLQMILDRLVVAAYLGEQAAGVYGASADLVRQVILFPGVAIGSAVVPIAIRLMTQGNRTAVDRHMLDSMELLLGVLAPAAAGMAIVAAKLSGLILGEEFHEAAASLIPIIVFAWLFRSVSYQFVHVSFQLDKKPALMGIQGAVILAANVAAMSILVPRFQLLGVAWSMLISEAGGVIVGYFLSRKAYRLPLEIWPICKVGLATAIMVVPTYFVDRNFQGERSLELALPVATGILAYAASTFALDVAGIRTKLIGMMRRKSGISTQPEEA
ncbi:polysaccharide biosynthesis protein [Rhizobium sp. ARZ01]|uniref:oligosaccharide flippase family protein n=1 Tax=Rhizobium sp. ARZ01 TaxID=2769313 RepID=UPI00177EFB7F|nr:oligosaccharide flippase family protein [Rhizobium sp. ARZ01]MBD9375016.1 polysaccharide biosynthesis protein [Rhizobium sp. ARZ01]